MKTKQCTCCGETFPATTEFWHKNSASKDGFLTRCKVCQNAKVAKHSAKPEVKARRTEYEATPERKAKKAEWQSEYGAEYRAKPENKAKRAEYQAEYDKARYEAQRLAEGKELGVRTMPTNFYVGYVTILNTTYFKIGVTSYDSMRDRYKKDPKYSGILDEVTQLRWVELESYEQADAMEKKFMAICREELGDPVAVPEIHKKQSNEYFDIPTYSQYYRITKHI